METKSIKINLSFDHYTIRMIIGLIAFFLPVIVIIVALQITDSISWSYYTDARDYFVGLLFVIGGFLISYTGHKTTENLVAWIGGIAACITAVCPTSYCIGENCPVDIKQTIHTVSAAIVFLTTAYFCLVAFKSRVKEKLKDNDTTTDELRALKLRLATYKFCGWGILITLVALVIVKNTSLLKVKYLTFVAETIALWLFGFAWLVACQYLPRFTSENKRRMLFSVRRPKQDQEKV